jgi:hypothetical protein
MGVSTAKKTKKLDPRVERLLHLLLEARRARGVWFPPGGAARKPVQGR